MFDLHTGHQLESQTGEEIGAWIPDGLAPRTTNVTAIRLFHGSVLGQPEKVLRCRRVPDRLPRTIPEEDVEHLIQAIYATARQPLLPTALRISEVVSLQVTDIRREEGLLHIREGKGHHERLPAVLKEPERYWNWPRPRSWLFYRHTPDAPITVKGLQAAFRRTRSAPIAGSPFTVCGTATHLLERGAPQSVVQDRPGTQVPGDNPGPHHGCSATTRWRSSCRPLTRPRRGGHHSPRLASASPTPDARSRARWLTASHPVSAVTSTSAPALPCRLALTVTAPRAPLRRRPMSCPW